MIISPTGKRVEEHIYASERTSGMIYRVVDPQTKCETGDEQVIVVTEGPLHEVFPSSHLRWLPNVLEGASGLSEADAQGNGGLAASNGGNGSSVGLRDRCEEIKDTLAMHFGARL